MGKGMPARTAAIAIAGVLLLLCLALAGHRSGQPADAETASTQSGDAIDAVAGDGSGPARGAHGPLRASRADFVPTGAATPASTAGASGAPRTACRGARRAAFSRLYALHARPADADEAIDAALLLLQMHREADAGALLSAASDRWPRDLELAWFAWSKCDPVACDRAARLRRLVALDPDNAVTWMYAVEDASRRRDDAGVDAALERAARAPGYATHEGVLFLHGMRLAAGMSLPEGCVASLRRMLEQDAGQPVAGSDIAIMEAENMENRALPPAYAVAAACRPSVAPAGSSRRAACVALFPRMADADTFLERTVGVTGLLDLVPGLPRNDPLRETYRRQQWLVEQGSKMRYPLASIPRMHADGGWKTTVALATAQGLWPPPANWLPDAPDARARVLGEPMPVGRTGRVRRE